MCQVSGIDRCVVDLYTLLGDSHGNYPFVEDPVEALWPPQFIFLHLLCANGHRRIHVDITGSQKPSSNVHKTRRVA